MEKHNRNEELPASTGERRDSQPYFIKVAAGAPVMVFPKRRKKATLRMWPEAVVAKEGVCFTMEDTVDSKNMEAQHPRHLGKKTEDATPEANQVISLNAVYERAGLASPVPEEETTAATSSSSRQMLSDEEAADPLIGNRVAGYVVEDTISAGGMGVVYRARQPDIGRCVAIKVLRPEIAASEEQSNRFFKEAQALSVIRHRGVTDIIQWGRLADRRQYIVMEYLEGDNLEDVMGRDGVMPVYRVLSIVGEVLDALSAAHKAGVVHRDLKPSNIFIAKQSDGTQCVKLLDFGLARQVPVNALDSREDGKLEKASMVAGTPEYIAPEQAKGLAATPRTDIYSLGVVAFEMLAGKLPFHTQSTVEMMKAHAYNEAPDIRDFAENIPSTLAELLISMLKKLPEERPRSTDEVKQRLHRISQQLKNEDTHIAVRLPQHLIEEQATEKPREKKFQTLQWLIPIVSLPLIAGLGMGIYVGYIVGPSTDNTDDVSITPVVEKTPAAPPPPFAVVTPPENPLNETAAVASPENANAELLAQRIPSPERPKPASRPPPPKPREPPAPAPALVPSPSARNIQPQPVDCNLPSKMWIAAVKTKLNTHNQHLTRDLRDTPHIERIKEEYRAYNKRINAIDDNNATSEVCADINRGLDSWLRRY